MQSSQSSLLSRLLQFFMLRKREQHIVDILIRERAPGLFSTPVLGFLARLVLYPLLGYREAVRIFDAMSREASGSEAMSLMYREVPFHLHVEQQAPFPSEGAVIVIVNHPTGICDAVAMCSVFDQLRDDIIFFANRDAIRVVPVVRDMMIPVEWVADKRTHERSRETLVTSIKAVRDGRTIIIFPAGRLAGRMPDGSLKEKDWNNTAVRLAQKYNAPIVLAHIECRNSNLFYFLSKYSTQLRDVLLFYEVLNKRGKNYKVKLTSAIKPERLVMDADVLTAKFQSYADSGFKQALDLPDAFTDSSESTSTQAE